jgi:hypothetical protein
MNATVALGSSTLVAVLTGVALALLAYRRMPHGSGVSILVAALHCSISLWVILTILLLWAFPIPGASGAVQLTARDADAQMVFRARELCLYLCVLSTGLFILHSVVLSKLTTNAKRRQAWILIASCFLSVIMWFVLLSRGPEFWPSV